MKMKLLMCLALIGQVWSSLHTNEEIERTVHTCFNDTNIKINNNVINNHHNNVIKAQLILPNNETKAVVIKFQNNRDLPQVLNEILLNRERTLLTQLSLARHPDEQLYWIR